MGFSREIQRGLGKLQTGILPVLGQAAADRWRSIVRVTGTGAESQDKKREQTGARKRTGRKRPSFLLQGRGLSLAPSTGSACLLGSKAEVQASQDGRWKVGFKLRELLTVDREPGLGGSSG